MRFTIVISIDYDVATLPNDMKRQLEMNVDRAVQEGLLDDSNKESVVDQYSVEVRKG